MEPALDSVPHASSTDGAAVLQTSSRKRQSSSQGTTRRTRTKTITINNIELIDPEECVLQPMTEGSYASYRSKFIEWATAAGLTSQKYADAIETTQSFTAEYLAEHGIFPSPQNFSAKHIQLTLIA